MGKVRSKKRRDRRLRPTGLPSVREAEEEQDLEGLAGSDQNPTSAPLMEKLASQLPSDREWACRSLSHLVFDPPSIEHLLGLRLVRRVGPLLVDQTLSVREAAAGALRNLSCCSDGGFCEQMAREDTMTPLAAMLKQCVSELRRMQSETPPTPMERQSGERVGGGKRRGKGSGHSEKNLKHQFIGIAEQGLHLLWNLSEHSSVVVEVFNSEGLLPVVLHFLQPASYPDSLVLIAAQCLHTILEDNQVAIGTLCSSPEALQQLEGVLLPGDAPTGGSLLLKTSVAGIFQNLLSGLSEPTCSQTARGVLSVLAAALDVNSHSLVTSLPTSPAPAEELEHVQSTLRAQQMALEILANVCYVEDEEGEDGGEWEDMEREETVGDCDGEMEMEQAGDVSQDSHAPLPPILTIVLELGLHEKVWRQCCSVDTLAQAHTSAVDAAPQNHTASIGGTDTTKILETVQLRSFLTLQNLISVLPPEAWGGSDNLTTVWTSLCALPVAGEHIVGVQRVLADKLFGYGVNCITQEQLGVISQVGKMVGEPSTRADAMALLGIAGKMALRNTPSGVDMLAVIGTSLRDCIATDCSLWVVAQALDSVFDVFGDDGCPPSLFVELSLMQSLKNMASTFKARLRVEKKSLGSNTAVVQNAKLNLPRFIQYMESRTKS